MHTNVIIPMTCMGNPLRNSFLDMDDRSIRDEKDWGVAFHKLNRE